MARRRARRALLVTLMVMGVGMLGLLLSDVGPHPRWKTFRYVHGGMTRGQVYAAVGGPPGDYRTRADVHPVPPDVDWQDYDAWVSDEAQMCVRFDPNGRVSEVNIESMLDLGEARPTVLQRLRTRLGL